MLVAVCYTFLYKLGRYTDIQTVLFEAATLSGMPAQSLLTTDAKAASTSRVLIIGSSHNCMA